MLITMSISFAPCRMAAQASAAFVSGRCAPSGKPTTQHTFTPEPVQELPGQRDPGRIHADREEFVLTRLAAELLDICFGGVRPQNGVVNQLRNVQRRLRRGSAAPPAPRLVLWDPVMAPEFGSIKAPFC